MASNVDLTALARVIQDVMAEAGLRLYDLEYNDVSRVLRVFIDKEKGGVTIKDCQNTSNAISRALDATEIMKSQYTLEVSSPGIERPLRNLEHFAWATGNVVEIDTGTERIKGFLRGTRDEGVIIALGTDEKIIPYRSIKKARVIEETSHGKRK
ncbi:MAG: ribosome maturation factor RimP [candidate division WOR-3 bacterium]